MRHAAVSRALAALVLGLGDDRLRRFGVDRWALPEAAPRAGCDNFPETGGNACDQGAGLAAPSAGVQCAARIAGVGRHGRGSMQPTMEVRWFGRAAVPADVERWFLDAELPPEREARRVDRYLVALPGDAVGVKVRQGRLEAKVRAAEGGLARWHGRLAGRVEAWRKWSLRLAEGDAALAAIEAGAADWLGVAKERRARHYAVTAERPARPTPVAARPAGGCTLELTRLEVGAQAWWTLGFEAFGADGAGAGQLDLVVAHVVARAAAPPPDLSATVSCGYPAWLRLVADAG
jgi:hypothetical protein